MASTTSFFPTLSFKDAPYLQLNNICPLIRTGNSSSSSSSSFFTVTVRAQRVKTEGSKEGLKRKPTKRSNLKETKPKPSNHSLTLEPSPANEKAQTSSNEEEKLLLYEDSPDFVFENGYTMSGVCDRLLEVFTVEKTTEEEWRKLLILSGEWSRIRPHFFKRLSYRAKMETDSCKKQNILTLFEKLKVVDEDMEKHNQLLNYTKEHWPELDVVVAGRRKAFSNDFFHYIELVCDSYFDRTDKRDDLARVAAKCLAAVQAHDRAIEDKVAVTIAQQKFDDILNSPSLEEACKKVDVLAKKKQLDSTLMLMFAKAWAAAQESSNMTEEVKELMHHLYLVARGHLQRLIPKEIRMLQRILAIEDPTQRFSALSESFAPAEESIDKDREDLHTKPEKLHKWMKLVLDGYHLNKQSTTMDAARQLMNPTIINRLIQLKEIVEDQFM